MAEDKKIFCYEILTDSMDSDSWINLLGLSIPPQSKVVITHPKSIPTNLSSYCSRSSSNSSCGLHL